MAEHTPDVILEIVNESLYRTADYERHISVSIHVGDLRHLYDLASRHEDMLEALKAIAVTHKGYPNANHQGQLARAAIARAEGTDA